MSHRPLFGRIASGLVSTLCLGMFAISQTPNTNATNQYSQLPLSFEVNMGQVDPQVEFFSHGPGNIIYFTRQGATLNLQRSSNDTGAKGDVIRLTLAKSTGPNKIAGEGEIKGKANYLNAAKAGRAVSNVPMYSHIRYVGAYPGVDLVYYGSQKQLEYDFEVAPNANPSQIHLQVEGAQALKVQPDGSLLIQGKYGSMRWDKPHAYQEYLDKGKVTVASKYVVNGNDVSFEVGKYNKNGMLVIDPQLVYSTYIGGSDFSSCCAVVPTIAVDKQGFAYIGGSSPQIDYPLTTGAYDTQRKTFQNSGQPAFSLNLGFVTKLAQDGSSLVYSTYLTGNSGVTALTVDDGGNAYITGGAGDYTNQNGTTYSFKTTPGAYRTTLAGCCSNVYVLKLDPSGSHAIYSTYIGNAQGNGSRAIALNTTDPNANPQVYVAGSVNSANPQWPTTPGSYQPVGAGGLDAFIFALSGDGSHLIYSTLLGGSANQAKNTNLIGDDEANGIKVRPNGDAVVTGYTRSDNFPATNTKYGQIQTTGNADIFVAELNATGSALVFSDLIGGPYDDFGNALDLDSGGNIYVAGTSAGGNFPNTNGAYRHDSNNTQDAVAFTLTPDGQTITASTFLGGTGYDNAAGIATDGNNVFVVGNTTSSDYPVTSDAAQGSLPSSGNPQNPNQAGFFTILDKQLSQLQYSTYVYGTGVYRPNNGLYSTVNAVALDPQGNSYITGVATPGLPTTANAYQQTTASPYGVPFVSKFGAASGAQSCSQGTVTITSPQNGFSGPSPVQFTATATSGCPITAIQVYQDNALVYQTSNSSLNTALNIPPGQHYIVVQAWNSQGNYFKTPVTINVTSGGGGGSCTAAAGTVKLCLPTNGSTVATPVEFSGGGALANETLLRLYLDNAPIYQTSSNQFDTSIDIGSGQHNAVLVGYDSNGNAQISSVNFTSTGTGPTGCGTPSTDQTILICTPAQGATVQSPFQLNARARWDGFVVSHMRVYSDNQPVYDQDYPPSGLITPTLSLPSGPHRIVIVAWNNQGASIVSPALNITVQ